MWKENMCVMTPVKHNKTSKKNATKSPAAGASPGLEAVAINPVDHQEEVMHTPDIMALLLDISSTLQATEFYIQSKQKLDADTTVSGNGGEPHQSPCQQAAT